MSGWDRYRKFMDQPLVEWTIFVLGLLLILVSPVVGAIPGPGGVFVFALGLAMVLKTSRWARRRYVKFKRWQPKAGRWTDWGLRRKSALRREAREKERKHLRERAIAGVPEGEVAAQQRLEQQTREDEPPIVDDGKPVSAAELSKMMDARARKTGLGD